MNVVEFRNAQSGNDRELKEVWKAGFGDGEEFIELFWSRLFSYDNCRVVVADNKITGMLMLLPTSIDGMSAVCIYAFTVLPEYRGLGIGAELIRDTVCYAKDRGYKCIFLHPGEEWLYSYYRELGFRDSFCVSEKTVECTGTADSDMEKLDAKDYTELRRELLKNEKIVEWEEKYIEFEKDICEMFGGGLYAFEVAGKRCAAAIEYSDEDVTVIKELLAPEEGISVIGQKFVSERYVFRAPGKDKIFGMAVTDEEIEDIYYGFAFD